MDAKTDLEIDAFRTTLILGEDGDPMNPVTRVVGRCATYLAQSRETRALSMRPLSGRCEWSRHLEHLQESRSRFGFRH